MTRIFNFLCASLSVMALAVSCKQDDEPEIPSQQIVSRFSYAVYHGTENGAYDLYSCAFTNEMLTDDLQIQATGYSLSLYLGTKVSGKIEEIPNLAFSVSQNAGVNRVLAGNVNPDGLTGSFLIYRPTSSSKATYYPIESGVFTKNGNSFSGTFSANGKTWRMVFAGNITYIDNSPKPIEPETHLNYAQALYYGEYYNGVNNYLLDVVNAQFDEEGRTVGPYTWLSFDLNTTLDTFNWEHFNEGTYYWTAYNSSNVYGAGTFVEGTKDEEGEFYPTYVETFDGESEYSYVFLATAGSLKISRSGSNYIFSATLTFDNKKTYNFTFNGLVDFFDYREEITSVSSKKYNRSIYSEHCRRKALTERLHNNWGCSGFDSTGRNCKHAVR